MNHSEITTKYTDELLELGERLADFLLSPSEIAHAEEVVKIKLSPNKRSVEFFKRVRTKGAVSADEPSTT